MKKTPVVWMAVPWVLVWMMFQPAPGAFAGGSETVLGDPLGTIREGVNNAVVAQLALSAPLISRETEDPDRVEQLLESASTGLENAQRSAHGLTESSPGDAGALDPEQAGQIERQLSRVTGQFEQMKEFHHQIGNADTGLMRLIWEEGQRLERYLASFDSGADEERHRSLQQIQARLTGIWDAERKFLATSDLEFAAEIRKAAEQIEAGLDASPLTQHEAGRIRAHLSLYQIYLGRLLFTEINLLDTRHGVTEAAEETLQLVDRYGR
jgi:hypothetical protein